MIMVMTSEDRYIDQVVNRVPRAMPLRDQLAREVRAAVAERVAHGETVEAALQQLGDPTAFADSYLSATPLTSATFMSRVAAKIIDGLTFLLCAVPFAIAAFKFTPPDVSPIALFGAWFVAVVLFGAYLLVAKAKPVKPLARRLWASASCANRRTDLVRSGVRSAAAADAADLSYRRALRSVHRQEPARVRNGVEDAGGKSLDLTMEIHGVVKNCVRPVA